MTAHRSIEGGAPQRNAHRRSGNGLVKLGWSQFWLVGGLLGGILGLIVVGLMIHLA
jgi:hypothetical protein